MSALTELKATARLALWTLAWVATVALAKFGPRHVWDPPQQAASWAAIAVNVAVGVGWIVAFTRFLRALDELQRKIMQDALAAALGVGWVLWFAYVVADQADLATADLNVAVLPVVVAVVFVVALAVGKIRYR